MHDFRGTVYIGLVLPRDLSQQEFSGRILSPDNTPPSFSGAAFIFGEGKIEKKKRTILKYNDGYNG